jgi:hypothetical protein
MSTRSFIAITNGDINYTAVYCHSDGYIEGVGQMLHTYYNSPVAARDLVYLGDLSRVGPLSEPIPGNLHSFDNPANGVTVAYYRDRDEDWEAVKPKKFEGYDRLIDAATLAGAEYLYIYDAKTLAWWVVELNHPLRPLSIVLNTIKETTL